MSARPNSECHGGPPINVSPLTKGWIAMQLNTFVATVGQDDLVIEEFGRNATAQQAPLMTHICGVTQLPAAADVVAHRA